MPVSFSLCMQCLFVLILTSDCSKRIVISVHCRGRWSILAHRELPDNKSELCFIQLLFGACCCENAHGVSVEEKHTFCINCINVLREDHTSECYR